MFIELLTADMYDSEDGTESLTQKMSATLFESENPTCNGCIACFLTVS